MVRKCGDELPGIIPDVPTGAMVRELGNDQKAEQ